MSAPVTLADIERLCWHLSGWSVQQQDVDRLLAAIEAYVQGIGADIPAPDEPAPAVQTDDASEDSTPQVQVPAADAVHWRGELTVRLVMPRARAPKGERVPMTEAERAMGDMRDAGRRRVCRKCRTEQALTEFVRESRFDDRRKWACRTCERARKRAARAARKAQGT